MAGQQGQVATPSYLPPTSPKAVANPSLSRRAGQIVGHIIQQGQKTLKGQFVIMALVAFILSLILALFSSMALQRAANDLTTIAEGSIPSVDAAQAMTQYMEDIDARAADFLATAALTETFTCTIPGSSSSSINKGLLSVHDCDMLTLHAEYTLANQQLFNAAHNVTYVGERTAIENITEGFEEYSAAISIMTYEYNQAANKTDPNDEHMQKAYAAYMHASTILHKQLDHYPSTVNVVASEKNIPSCQVHVPVGADKTYTAFEWSHGSLETNLDCLSSINQSYLNQAYEDTESFLSNTQAWALILCFVFWAILLFAMLRMIFISHRIINPGLTLSFLTGVIFGLIVLALIANLTGRQGVYGQMVKDDYDSVYYANLLKRYGTNANADESRWLIAQAYKDQANSDYWSQDWLTNVAYVKSLISKAHANRTWPEEDQPLNNIDPNWDTYYSIDDNIRSIANDTSNPNHLQDAERLSTGDSNKSFSGFIDAVDQLRAANYDHYHATYDATKGSLQSLITWCFLLFPCCGLVALWGVTQRLKDF